MPSQTTRDSPADGESNDRSEKHAAPPATFQELIHLLQDQRDAFSPAHARIARQILSDPEGSAFMTISELATVVGVDQSTVVRFAARVGLRGYPQLIGLCREHLRDRAQLVDRFERLQDLVNRRAVARQPGADDVPVPLDAVSAADQGNIVRTLSHVDSRDWTLAVTACTERRSVYVVGMRKCYSVAYLLAYLLGMIRDDVHQVSSEAGLLPDTLRRLGPDDVCIGITIHRYASQTLQGLRFARRRGAFTIVFTDNAASPVVPYADVVFYVETSSLSVLRSMTAFVSLCQALVSSVAVRRGTETRSALLVEEDVLNEFGAYVSEADLSNAGSQSSSHARDRYP